jgi:hypothetical protein
MPSHKAVYRMRAAIEWCCHEYPGLPKILKVTEVPEEWTYEVMAFWGVSRRTAHEYLMVAAHKLKMEEKEDGETGKSKN